MSDRPSNRRRGLLTFSCGHASPVAGSDASTERMCPTCALSDHVNVANTPERCPACGKLVQPGQLHR